MRETLGVIMLMRVDFLSQLLQREACTGGLIFLLRASQNKKGWRVSVSPVALGTYVGKCVRSCVLSAHFSVCVRIFHQGEIQEPPDAGAICSPDNQRPLQNGSSSEPWFTGSLPVNATITGMCNMFYPRGREVAWRECFFSQGQKKCYVQVICLVLKFASRYHIACEDCLPQLAHYKHVSCTSVHLIAIWNCVSENVN